MNSLNSLRNTTWSFASKILPFAGLFLLTACETTIQPTLKTNVSSLYEGATIEVDIVGINTSEYQIWKAKSVNDYFTSSDHEKLYLGGVPVGELCDDYGLELNDLAPYLPANSEGVEAMGVDVHYLGYYLKWHPQSCYYYAVEHGGFQASPERTPGTYSKYNSIDDRIDDFHYWTTHIKFGIGRATYDAAQEIRSGDITHEEGVALVKRFDGEWPERFADEIFAYLSINPKEFPVASKRFREPIMTRESFLELAETFRSPHLWKHVNGEWQLRHSVWQD